MFCNIRWLRGIALAGSLLVAFSAETYAETIVYLSPSGHADADGSKERPFASVDQALSKISGKEGGTIFLLGGTYQQRVVINGPSSAGRMIFAAAPGEKVVFEGGSAVDQWTEEGGGLYSFTMSDVEVAYSSERGWLDLWEAKERVRYLVVMDEAGVKAHPGSACFLDETTVLVHPRRGSRPDAVALWRNRLGSGLEVLRSKVTVRGIAFHNFTGGQQARAVTIRGNDVSLEECSFFNNMRGASIASERVRVEGCRFADVAQGIFFTGKDLTVRHSIIESAQGDFAFRGLNAHLRDGIRIYHPAEGAVIEECVTRGFWAGLYIKTSPPLDARQTRPFRIRQNTFLDGIRWGGGQMLAHYLNNMIGRDEEGVDLLRVLPPLGAKVTGNYLFNGRKGNEDNLAGPEPFVNATVGDLRIREGVKIPSAEGKRIGAAVEQVTWITKAFEQNAATESSDSAQTELAFQSPVVCTASREGAVVAAIVNHAADGVLYYRKAGEEIWKTRRGVDVSVSNKTGECRLRFPLADGRLESECDYDYYLKVTSSHGGAITTDAKRFRTHGEPREWHVSAAGEEKAAPGASAPLASLQSALDRALPGDRIILSAGLYTDPAILVHGGRKEAPLRIEGAGMEATIMDGGRIPAVMLDLRHVSHVQIRGIQFRWFQKAGVKAEECQEISVAECLFRNNRGGGVEGKGISLQKSPGTTIERSVFTRLEYGIMAIESPGLRLRNNTAVLNLYSSVLLLSSSKDSVITGNSFTFTGNLSLRIVEPSKASFHTLQCDYNNYAAHLPSPTETSLRSYKAASVMIPEKSESVAPSPHYQAGRMSSKRVIDAHVEGEHGRYFRMSDWQKATGKDAHSIFADPLYADPRNGDFHLLPDSPNILPEGRIIGALGKRDR